MSGGKHLGKGSSIPILPDDGILRLYSMRFCPFAQRAHLVLNAKNIPYHSVYIDLTNKPEWLPQKSPLGKVPALEFPTEPKKQPLIESLIICDYLDEKYPELALYPTDPYEKAKDRILIERFNPVIGSFVKVFYDGQQPGCLTEIKIGLDIFEAELKRRNTPFFGGDRPMMLDYMIWPWCERADMLKYLLDKDVYVLDNERFGNLLKWRALMIEQPAVKAHYIDGETHAKYMKGRRTGTPNYDMLINLSKKQKTY